MKHRVVVGAGLLAAAACCPSPARAQWFVRPNPYYYPAPVYPPGYYPPPPVYRPMYPSPMYAPPVYAPPVYAPPRPSASLMEVQRLLVQMGYDPGPIDGLPGPRLTDAVQAFQRDHDESPNGRLGGETIGAIREAARTRESQTVPVPAAPLADEPHYTAAPPAPRSTLSVKPSSP